MAAFEELPESRLSPLGDDDLIAYMRGAREARAHDAIKPALAILVYGYWDTLLARARLKLPPSEAEDVAAEAVISAIASAFDGKSVGEFRAWLHTILSRRIADYLEARKRKPKVTELASEHAGEDEVWGDEPATPFEGEALFARECLDRSYDELSELHRRVIDLHVLGPHAATAAAELLGDGMTEANVNQIASRFQKRFRQLLDEGDTSG